MTDIAKPVNRGGGCYMMPEITAACPTIVMRSRCPRAFMRSTQNPLSALWNVTRSTVPASTSRSVSVEGDGVAMSLNIG